MISVGTSSQTHKVREFVEGLTYSCPKKYVTRPANKILESGKAHCLEASLLAASLMEKLGHAPIVLYMWVRNYGHGTEDAHAVYLYTTGEGYGSIGKSGVPELQSRDARFKSLKELVESYEKGFAKDGERIFQWDVLNLNRFPFPWRKSELNLPLITEYF